MNTTFSNQAAEETLGKAASSSDAEPAKLTEQDIRAAYSKT
jgi:hypothetical protein